MAFTLPPLPYDVAALAPHISAETLQFHHGKHHAGYVKKLNDLVKGTEYEAIALEDVIRRSSGGIFNNAAQVWNHTFYFKCMKPQTDGGGKEPQGALRDALMKKWTSYDKFKEEFSQVAAGHFGSGWAWLNYNKQKKELEIQQTHDAGNPLTETNQVPLLCCDVWEHAYYIDRRNDRGAYIKAWWEVVNWAFAEQNYAAALK